VHGSGAMTAAQCPGVMTRRQSLPDLRRLDEIERKLGCRNSCAAFLHRSTSLINIARSLGLSVRSAERAQCSAWRSYKRARSGMACPLGKESVTDLVRAALTGFNATGTKLTQENTLISCN